MMVLQMFQINEGKRIYEMLFSAVDLIQKNRK